MMCAKCRFFIGVLERVDGRAECRRYAPRVLQYSDGQDSYEIIRFPKVKGTDFYGEFQEKPKQ
jgi:hypothetical protein